MLESAETEAVSAREVEVIFAGALEMPFELCGKVEVGVPPEHRLEIGTLLETS
jgi:hypothetical protein